MEEEIYADDENSSELYVFRNLKVEKVEPIGNLEKNIPCPFPRSGHRMVVYKGNIFAFGGYSPRNVYTDEIIIDPGSRNLFKELWKFNFATKTWLCLETVGDMPSEAASHSALLMNNFMLVYGGTSLPFGLINSNNIYLCNLDTLKWTKLYTTGDIPEPSYGQAIAMYKDKLYVVGGTTGHEFTLAVHCLDFGSLEWFRLDTLKSQYCDPPKRYRHEIVIYGDKIYVFGGGTSVESFGFKSIPVFDLTQNIWNVEEVTCRYGPAPRLCHGCVQVNDFVYIFGGQNKVSSFSDIWRFDLKHLNWSRLEASLPMPLYFHSVALSSEGQVFIFGGVTDIQEDTRTNNVYSLWLKIPSLAAMCWNALTFYVSHISRIDKMHLLKLGIPLQYISRLE